MFTFADLQINTATTAVEVSLRSVNTSGAFLLFTTRTEVMVQASQQRVQFTLRGEEPRIFIGRMGVGVLAVGSDMEE